MAQKVKIECPRCDGKGVIPQYFYNKKGICFLCWGSGTITVKVPAGKSPEDYAKELAEKERIHLKNNPPKVEMPDANKHRNKDYFEKTKTKLPPINHKQLIADKIGKLSGDDKATVEDWKKLLSVVKNAPDYDGKNHDIATIEDAIDILTKKPDDDAGSERIGRVDKSKGGDITIVAVAGGLNIGTYTNAKTGATEYTVYPEGRVSTDAFNQYKSDMKQFGGYYSRFKGKHVFTDNPTDAVKKWVAEGNGNYGTDGGTGTSTNTGTNTKTGDNTKPSGTAFQYMTAVEDDLKKRGKDLWDLSKDELQKIKDDLDALGVTPRVKRFYDRVTGRLNDRIKQEQADIEANDWLKKTNSLGRTSTIDELEEALKEGDRFRYRNDDTRYRMDYLNILFNDKLSAEMNQAIKNKTGNHIIEELSLDDLAKVGEAIKPFVDKYKGTYSTPESIESLMNRVKKRRDELNRQSQSKVAFKNTELANKVKAIVGQGLSTTEQTQKVGEVVREEVEKRYLANKKKVDDIEAKIKLAETTQAESRVRLAELRKTKPNTSKFSTEYSEWARKWNEEVATHNDAVAERKKLTGNIEKNPMAKIIREVVADVREMGTDEELRFTRTSNANAMKRILKMRAVLPKEWINALNNNVLSTKDSKGRNYYRNGDKLLSIGSHLTTVVHEMLHGVEYAHSTVAHLIGQYYDERTSGQALVHLGEGYDASEKYRPSNNGTEWLSKYMGKDYGRDAHEVLTMGVQLAYERDYNYMMQDADFYRFILGVMAGA